MNFKKSLGLLFAALTLGTSVSAVNYYEYVVITKRDLIPAFNELLTWKNQKGLKAGAVAIEDILADPAFKNGDLVSGINDDAGKLRAYLKSSKDKGIGKYVLLGGMDEIVPIRYGTGYNNSWSPDEWGKETDKIPSDFYFSHLDGKWNKDGDKYYGEQSGDDVWVSSSSKNVLYVGRLLCRNSDDIKTWTKKLLIYEQNPGIGNPGYLLRSFMTLADGIGNYTSMKNSMPTDFKNGFKYWNEKADASGTPIFPKAAEVINEINQSKYGLLINANHGNTMQYAVATRGNNSEGDNNKYQIVAKDDYDILVDTNTNKRVLSMTIPEVGNGFDNLTNYDSPAIMYSLSCDNMPFDDYGNRYKDHGMRNLGESFLCMSKGGGVAYFGNTRYGFSGASSSLAYLFFAAVQDNSVENRLGILEYQSKVRFRNSSSYSHFLNLSQNLVGCPETYFWSTTPKKFSGISISTDGKGKYWVNNVNVNNAVVCITGTKADGTLYQEKRVITSSYKTPEFTNVPSDYVVVVTADGYIPYIKQGIDKCIYQNVTYTGTATEKCDYIIAGSQVTTSKKQGDVVIKSGAKVTFDAKNTTRIEGGFQVKKGGQLIVK